MKKTQTFERKYKEKGFEESHVGWWKKNKKQKQTNPNNQQPCFQDIQQIKANCELQTYIFPLNLIHIPCIHISMR